MTGLSCSGKCFVSRLFLSFSDRKVVCPASNPHELSFGPSHAGPKEKDNDMRRQDIQLLASARQGDLEARYEVGRRYLLGVDGFPQHTDTGLEYLAHPSLEPSERTARTIADALPLHELVRRKLLLPLAKAARGGSISAQVKLALWRALTNADPAETTRWLDAAAAAGDAGARAAAHALQNCPSNAAADVLDALKAAPGIDLARLVPLALSNAVQSDDPEEIARVLSGTLTARLPITPELADAACSAIARLEDEAQPRLPCANGAVEALLEDCIRRGNATAELLLGRALSAVDTPALPASLLTTGQNLRRGAALLLRAADAGLSAAWMVLYRIHADNHSSVSNPQMARFFLEKAALAGELCAQRRLGALILRSATTVHESEQGIHWLHQAARRQDALAAQLLGSLVLPVAGSDAEADAAIDAVRREDPWLACRLRTARDFGLTKLEAMSVDIVAGLRPWGLVVGPNPSIAQAKLAAPRAIPALRPQAFENLRRSATFLEQSRQDGSPIEGDRRKRTHRLRYCLERSGIDESLFFAKVRSTALNTLRQGPKWAFHAQQPLRMALAA
jgi:TPR repeat protein